MRDFITENFLDNFRSRGIELDDFQKEAMAALAGDSDVLVCAPTGSGKTVVAQYAIELALAKGVRCIYTAPIKALSNQKYREFAQSLGGDTVGLLTGDTTINRDAQVLVVTTEVLRNMLFLRDNGIADIGYVVLDEVHYLSDKVRGPVWEEIILQLPSHIRLVSLSATIANIEEFSHWLRSVRGRTTTVTSFHRPVPLEQALLHKSKVTPILDAQGELTDQAAKLISHLDRGAVRNEGRRRARKVSIAQRKRVIATLDEHKYLPAIEFIFSRKGCDNAVKDLLDADIVLTDAHQQKAIRAQVKALRETLSDDDARAVRFGLWSKALVRGFSAHHAGMFPAIKELTESLMVQGLLKIVYATGTLSLGIDMPVRAVVVEDLHKWDGTGFSDLTATEYTQLIGRAGRRGKDDKGYAFVLASADIDLNTLERLAQGAMEPLESAFFPSYNTVVSLLAIHGREEARAIMGTSFAQFQKNADLGQIQGRIQRIQRRIRELETELAAKYPHLDVVDYVQLRQQAGRASKAQRRTAKEEYRRVVEQSWRGAKTGHLYAYARDGELEYGVALSVSKTKIRLVNVFAEMVWLNSYELSSELRDLGTIEMPFGISPKDPAVREDIAQSILDAVDERSELGTDRDLVDSWDRFAVRENPQLVAHSVHQHSKRKEILADATEYMSLESRLSELNVLVESFEDSVAKEFDATADILNYLGYLQDYSLAGGAHLLRGIHNESDLLISMCLNEPSIKELTASEFAGICSAFLGDRRLGKGFPRKAKLRAAWAAVERNFDYINDVESRFGIQRTLEPDPGGVEAFVDWANGEKLDAVLLKSHIDVGDFISASRRLLDLLGQLKVVGSDFWLGDLAAEAITKIRRWEWL
ncbi:DEAD/DEAH box helicase [Arcanobacterium bovis]|uniref:DEAD/DEAH box helicase n=1 Tax=Arcanobacterium bovis TaxID=2529275 RepID=A0A4Q9V381_9ACTO|nr:DEAD/DEAH box helicase [Arcanobacterium bovis]TBW22932.1 DEAD/DEAH box helicase [Arcanobacterium bovis]